MAKRVWVKIQDSRRALWTIDHSSGMLEGGADMVSFYLVQCEERLRRLEVYLPIVWSIRLGGFHALSRDNWHQIAV